MGNHAVAIALLLIACGDNERAGTPDAPITSEPDATAAVCGNNLVEAGEECDDGATVKDAVCDADCTLTCGNGTVDTDVGETCDAAAPAGCPAACDDGDTCTAEVLSGSECTAACVASAITDAVDRDGCCPIGADANSDDDCAAACGNGVLETGELCDLAIVAGVGACPTTCNDGIVCTTDALVGAGSCQAMCTAVTITTPANGDGCCPSGANAGNDNDCSPMCGNGVREANEVCDTGIVAGMPNACPTACNDNVACTTNTLGNGGTCQAVCLFPPITTPVGGDGCCPTGATANTDTDCAPRCGNGAAEAGEQCDDGNQVDTDACGNDCLTNIVATAYRFTDLNLRDPHVWVNAFGCRDVTPEGALLFSVNDELQTSIATDGDMPPDGVLDLSPTLVFRPFAQGAASTPVEFHFASCTAPVASTACTPGTAPPALTTARNMTAGQCFAALPGTTRPYAPAITAASGPCFVTDTVRSVTISLGGIPITLRDARLAGTYVGNPAASFTNGLLAGFISEAEANATIIPADFPLIGGQPLSALLPGGTGNCNNTSDKDTVDGVVGWWFYLNFPASRVPWAD